MGYTAFMQQYLAVKNSLPKECLLLFRLGDFYELFFDDAVTASALLDLVLTSREGGQGRVAMCGIPFHAAPGYVQRLIRAGEKVAICEQVEDPKKARGLVRREVTRIITPSTFVEDESSDGKDCRYLVAVAYVPKRWGLACLEPTTGEFSVSECSQADEVLSELVRISPTELLIPQGVREEGSLEPFIGDRRALSLTTYEDWRCEVGDNRERVLSNYQLGSLKGLGLGDHTAGLAAIGMILQYLKEHRPGSETCLRMPKPHVPHEFLLIDPTSERSLELIPTGGTDKESPTLLAILDETVTPMGGRLLRQWLKRPLLSPVAIRTRLDAVETWVTEPEGRNTFRELLQPVRDLERLLSRISYGVATPRDMGVLRSSLAQTPFLKAHLQEYSDPLVREHETCIHDLAELRQLLAAALTENPPPHLRDGGVIREGFHPPLDELRAMSRNAKNLIAALQAREIARTGIKSLKVGYNKVFGYFIEVSSANLGHVPADYIRKQTLSNAERFITPELKEYEDKILNAEEQSRALEQTLFEEIRQRVVQELDSIRDTAEAIANLDVLSTLALVAVRGRYTRPEIDEGTVIHIRNGRHPVVERVLGMGRFIENDCLLDHNRHQFLLITGPNMAGKSCYLRQTALIVILAQIGSFVPATGARIGIVDRLFTRIGASDNLARGESTFMVEMLEVANILHHATPRSLVLLDEVGRGTSTLDGVSIARAVAEYLTEEEGPRPRTMFATHYHELTDLGERITGIENLTIAVREGKGEVVFLHKIMPGATDKSYGIYVARLAGLPPEVVERAEEILDTLEVSQKTHPPSPPSFVRPAAQPRRRSGQLTFFPLSVEE
ncbi:MAG: DNA mismatch repair protein MutS [Candidatus Methylomirabilales bacterium]